MKRTSVEIGIANDPTIINPGRRFEFENCFHPAQNRKNIIREAIAIRMKSHGLGHDTSTSRMSGVDFTVPVVK